MPLDWSGQSAPKGRPFLYDVLVIGGGPVGSQVAYRLSTAGRKVAVVEQTDLYCPVCCTGIVSEECVREYEIDETVIRRYVNGAFLYSPSGRVIRLYRNEPQAAVLDRPAFNALMAARARSCGADYFKGARVTDVAIADEHVTIRCGDGQP